ncbi:protein containing RNA polymerase sigma-70 [Candidatus Magnetomorum sp. HK-1]|nr:protein containing RNA polymerase sigma-70 [Candidatus Magnetomorum sp. HK-1]
MDQISGWVEQAQTGNRFALNQLIDHFQNDIFRMVYYRIHHQADAEDITQDIFIQMIRRIRTLKDRSRFKPWLYRIAINRVRDFFRKKRLLFFMGTSSEIEADNSIDNLRTTSPENDIFRKELNNLLKDLSKELSKWEREIFLLRYLDDMDVKDIAITLGKNENTVKTHLYRAVKKFKKHNCLRDFIQRGEYAK